MLPLLLRSSAAAVKNVRLRPRRSLVRRDGRLVGIAGSGDGRDFSAVGAGQGGGSPEVAVQLDYYMSLQFAGVACALVNDVYRSKGISDLRFLPTCPPGEEAARVRAHQDAHPATLATFGTVEQNILVPALRAAPALGVTAVAAMCRRSPLCVASLGPLEEGAVVAAHVDTVDLLQRLLPRQRVEARPRGIKTTDLLEGRCAGVQAYATTEVPALRRRLADLGRDPGALTVRRLEGLAGDGGPARLGYSQVLFAADEALGDADRRGAATAFLEGTFEGWRAALRDPDGAVQAVAEAKKMLGLDDEAHDHWHASADFDREMLRLMSDHVKETYSGDRLGVLHPERWAGATEWLLRDGDGGEDVDPLLGLDRTGLWQPPANLLSGNELGRTILEEANDSALKFAETHGGRKPSLAVVTVGDLKRYEHAERRLQLYSNPSNSWFTKTETGEANGFAVTEVRLEAETTTDALLSEIYRLRDEVDGIQVMWPLPPGVDAARVYNAVPLAQDVDGIHYAAWGSLYSPVTPAGALALAREHGVRLAGRHALVVGRSPIVGAPLARLLRDAGAMVTVAHASVDREVLAAAAGRADVVFACAGEPGVLEAAWLKEGAEVISVGTTFCAEEDALLPDVEGDVGARAARYSPVPGGVGPLSAPMLFRNVARAAWDQAAEEGASSWREEPAALR